MCRFISGHSWFTVGVLMGAVLMGLLSVAMASADVFHMPPGLTSLETVFVGNPGNAGDTRYPTSWSDPPVASFGAVGYVYNIGKYEVTAGQYCEFLNKVAATDTYGLYNPSMDRWQFGCQITRHGTSGNYTYDFSGRPGGTTEADWANRPVDYVSWGDAARFANWLHNGQPTGAQGLSTTEDGAYYLNGATSDEELLAVTREADWKWAITNEDEWYKAAYHCNDGITGNYWDYPTASDVVPNNGNPEGDTGNTANFYDGDLTVGDPYYTTPVGYFGLSDSPYGTFDQGSNVWEWNETAVFAYSSRGMRGGGWGNSFGVLHAATRWGYNSPTYEYSYGLGFRVASLIVPEPSSMTLLVVGAIATLLAWRRRTTR